jgi:preprotein translocase subunit SecF
MNLLNLRLWWHISWITTVVCIALIVIIRPTWGIDFTGGSLLEIPGGVSEASTVEEVLRTDAHLSTTIQTTQANTLLIRTSPLSPDQLAQATKTLKDHKLLAGEIVRFESIGPTIGAELTRKAWWALSLALVLIIGYLAYTFRGAKTLIAPWKFGVAAIYALLHDLIFVTALFVILGKWKGVEIDTLFVTAQLAIFGYSVNDTIIIFDRLKSEWLRSRSTNLPQLMNKAVGDTLMRSLNTSLNILVVLLALMFFGGPTIYWFVLALTVGTIVGTYSSIFVATPCLYYLSRRQWK